MCGGGAWAVAVCGEDVYSCNVHCISIFAFSSTSSVIIQRVLVYLPVTTSRVHSGVMPSACSRHSHVIARQLCCALTARRQQRHLLRGRQSATPP